MDGLTALLKAGARSLRNGGRVLGSQSRLKVAFIAAFSAGLLVGLYAVFHAGFRFLDTLGGVGLLLVLRLLALFFWGLGIMMVLSGFIASFAALFRSPEMDFLLARPASPSAVVLFKAVESAWLSSWAYFFVVIPFIAAYAREQGLPWFLAGWALAYSVPFVLICAGLGVLACLAVARWAPRGRWAVAALLLLAGAWVVRDIAGAAPRGAADPDATLLLARLAPGLNRAAHPLWPSWWLAEGMMSMVRGHWSRGLLLLSALVSSALLVGLLIERVGGAWFYPAWLRLRTSGLESALRRDPRRAAGPARRPILAGIDRWLPPVLPRDVRALVAKDVRLFFRDPAQWTQGLFFFALLGLYFMNLRTFRYHDLDLVWRNVIAFLNLFSVAAVMCSFGSRFVYPQLSLEGQSVWILDLSPAGLRRAFLTKFGVSVTCLLAISVGLNALSASMLRLDGDMARAALAIAAALALGVSGLSTGLGAVFLDLRQTNPAAIVSGFGGTLNLILNLLLILAAILPFAALHHLHASAALPASSFAAWRLGLWCWLLGLTVLSTAVPLAVAWRSLSNREF